MKIQMKAMWLKMALLLPLVCLFATGCPTLKENRPDTPHLVVGVWEYRFEGLMQRREFTADYKCIVYRGRPFLNKKGEPVLYEDHGEASFVGEYYPITDRKVYVERVNLRRKDRLEYEVLDDGRMSVEGRHIANRVSY
ncbi:MAG: hypothetical protein HQ559_04420 [Lentisphaerae bacterium]|nr:hypothetical protein [Lentisphaerota bacterium]